MRAFSPTALRLAALAAVTAILAILTVRAHFTFGSVTYEFLRDARALVDGGGIRALSPLEPPGYPLLLAGLMALGIDPMLAGFVLSLAAFVATALLAHRLIEWGSSAAFPRHWIFPATLVFVLQERMVSLATQAWVEGLYVTATLGALVAFETMRRQRYCLSRPRQGILMMVALAAPFWLRYVGILVSASVAVALLIGAIRHTDPVNRRQAIRDVLIVGGGAGLLCALLLARNLWLTHTLTGHPVGLSSEYTFHGALREMVWRTGLDAMGIPSRAAERLGILAPRLVWFLSFAVLIGLLVTAARRPLVLLIAFNLGAYLVLFAWLESSTRIDVIQMRFVFPAIPLITLLLIYNVPLLLRRGARRALGVAAVALLFVSTAGGLFKAVRGAGVTQMDRSFGYSPQTLGAVRSVIAGAPRASIVGNRFGKQLLAYCSEHDQHLDFTAMPFRDSRNGGYNDVYGIHPWTEPEARAHFRAHHTQWIVFFEGPAHDPYLQEGAYGPFIARLHDGIPGLEVSRKVFPDGALIEVDPSRW
jgi:hypothetical protein